MSKPTYDINDDLLRGLIVDVQAIRANLEAAQRYQDRRSPTASTLADNNLEHARKAAETLAQVIGMYRTPRPGFCDNRVVLDSSLER